MAFSVPNSRDSSARNSPRPGNASAGPSGLNGGPPPATLDPYKVLPSALKRPIQVFTAENALASSSTAPDSPLTPILPGLLSLTPIAYSSRLFSRQILLETPPASTNPEIILLEASRAESIRRAKKRSIAQLDVGGIKHAAQEARGSNRKSLGLISRKEAKRRKLYKVQKGDKVDWEDLQPLWWMHLGYMSDLLGLPDKPGYVPPVMQDGPLPNEPGWRQLADSPTKQDKPIGKGKEKAGAQAGSSVPQATSGGQGKTNGMSNEAILSKLIKCDMVGAMIKVKSSKSPTLTIHQGLVIQETAGTFKLVNRKAEVKIIPKNNSLLTISFPAWSYRSLPGRPDGLVDGAVGAGRSDGGEGKAAGGGAESPPPAFMLEYDPFEDPVHIASTTAAALEHSVPPDLSPAMTFTRSLLSVPTLEIDILGSAFVFRTEDRAGRRFKPKEGGGGWDEGWVGWWGDGLVE